MQKEQLILVTNDDGYQARGINAVVESLIGLGEIVVVAPDGPRSGMSSAITTADPLRYKLLSKDIDNNITIYSCTGTPVDCVKLAVSEILEDRTPDLLVSGINHGSNASICILYSGTMGAAIEGSIFGIPSIGFSLLDHHHDADFNHTEPIVRSLSKDILEKGLPKGVCLNVNIPNSAKDLRGLKVCQQTKGKWIEEFKKSKDGANNDVFWLTGSFENYESDNDKTDEWALAHGYVSVVPIAIDMTAYDCIQKMKFLENL